MSLTACTAQAALLPVDSSPSVPPAASATPSPAPVTPSPSPAPSLTPPPSATPLPTATPLPSPTSGPSPTPTPDLRPDPQAWSGWAVIPTVSARAKEIYRQALARGSDPHGFSTIGDCQSEPNVFLGIYATDRYWLGKDYAYLQETVDYFKGSFDRQSLAVRDGLSAPSALDPLWAYKDRCQANEGPVACDLRVHKPAIVFINLGTNWRADVSVDPYEKYLRQIVDLVIQGGALPLLATKADDVEGGQRINLVTARVAHDYDIPLWNLWRAVQDLDNHGLDPARKDVYLSVEAWDRRSFTALRVLDRLRNELKDVK